MLLAVSKLLIPSSIQQIFFQRFLHASLYAKHIEVKQIGPNFPRYLDWTLILPEVQSKQWQSLLVQECKCADVCGK